MVAIELPCCQTLAVTFKDRQAPLSMKKYSLAFLLGLTASIGASAATLTEVYQNNDFQMTGISLSKTGRLFLNFPRWSDRYLNAVVEVLPDGSTKPFPDAEWNQWDLKPEAASTHFVCVQSVVVDSSDSLWVLDAAAPLLGPSVMNGPKMVQIDLKSNKVTRVISFPRDVATAATYLNDVRFDLGRNTAYITDSGQGGLIIVNLSSGTAHRVLDGHPSVLPEPGVQVVVNGKALLQFGKPPQFRSDSLALTPDGQYVYYKAITANTLYRIKTDVLRDTQATQEQVAAAVEKAATVFPTDGFWMDSQSNLYLSDVTHNAVSRLTPNGKIERVVSDPRLQWPDTFSQGPDDSVYITASHINDGPNFNNGKSVRKLPYQVFKFRP